MHSTWYCLVGLLCVKFSGPAPKRKNYADFLSRLPQLIKWYDAEGYNYAKHVFDVQAEFDPNPAEGTMDVTLSTIDGAPVYYTLDGTEPTAASSVYEGVLKIKENVTLSAKAIRPNGESKIVTEKIDFSKSSMKPIVANQPINEQYLFKGASTLIDGLKGNSSYKSVPLDRFQRKRHGYDYRPPATY